MNDLAPLDNQELDKELREEWLKLVDNYFPKDKRHARGQAINITDEVIQLILSEAHRIGNLAIGEINDIKHSDVSKQTIVRNRLKIEQRQKLKNIIGIKE
jgi:hypothetical protein